MASRFTDRLCEIGDIVRVVEVRESEQVKKAA
jgi:hypothetical protein